MDQGISPKLKNITSIVAGTSGQFLQTKGPGPSPIWANAVTSITAGTGLTGGTITTTGTIAIGTSGVTAGTYQGLVVNTLGQVTSASNQSYGTGSVTSITTGTGLTGGPVTTSGTISIGTSGVTAGTYLGLTVNALGQITAEAALNISKQFSYIGTAANGTIQLDSYAPFAYTITAVDNIACTSGSATVEIAIGTTAVTGLSAIAVNTTGTNYTASGANSVSVGNTVNVIITSGTTGVNLQFTLAATRTT
jgi:hypothetical protein